LLLATLPAAAEAELARQVLAEINLARTDPNAYTARLKEFRRQFRGKAFLLADGRTRMQTSEGIVAVDEAIRALSRQKPLPPLAWSDGLAAAAAELAQEQGKSGATGHGRQQGGMQQRIERHSSWTGRIGENIGYGPEEARLLVMQLLVDDGVRDRGHRANILHRGFATAGVACGPHPNYGSMCVIDFAGGFR
jgi:uncharacterized protein YkwD